MIILRSGPAGGRMLAALGLLAIGLTGCEGRVEAAAPGQVRSALTAGPDLLVSAFTPPATVASQELVSFSWTIANAGSDTATATYQACCTDGYYYRWADAVYLSADAAYSPDDLLVGKLWRANDFKLTAGSSYTATASLQLPAVAEGAYYLVLVTDSQANRVVEGDESNNTLAAPVTVGKADLSLSAASAPAVAGAQELINLSWTVANTGSGGASGKYLACCASGYYYKWEDAAYLSADATLSADDLKFGSLLRADQFKLAAGASYTATAAFQLPAAAEGNWNILLVTDSAGNRVDESDESDNVHVLPITIGKADLSITSVTVPALVGAQELVNVSWTVANTGSGGASGKYLACCASGYYYKWEDAAYLSADATLSADDLKFGSLLRADQFKLAAGESYSATAAFQLPVVPEGSYYLLMVTDSGGDRVFESSETNNVSATPITVGKADLSVTNVTAPAMAGAQELVNVSWTVANTGTAGASGKYVACCGYGYYYKWDDAAYLSADATLSADDIRFGTLSRANQFNLAAGASYSATAAFQLPVVPEGSYYLILSADAVSNRVAERDEGNNALAIPITIGRADLAVTAVSAPAQAGVLKNVSLSWTVTNQGTGGATGKYVACCSSGYYYRWEDAAYLSTDAVLSADDVKAGAVQRSDSFTLAPGSSYSVTVSFQLPEVTEGTYYLLFVTDSAADRVLERDEGNNVHAVPIVIGWGDLMVSAIGAPATVFPRAPVAFSWTVMNAGNAGATGRYVSSGTSSGRRWEDSLYVSTDPSLSADDLLLGTVPRADGFFLESGAKYTATKSTTVPELPDGLYYLLAVADSTGDRVPELDEGNNVLSLPITISAASTTSTGANPGCDQFPLRTMNDNCTQNCCADHDLCLVQNDCAGAGAGSAACQACDEAVLLCGGDCVNGVKDCATTPCGCGQSLCYSMSCAAGQPGYCAKDCNTPLNDVCLMRQRPGQAMVGAALPQTALADVITAGYRFTPKRAGRAVALGGSFDGTRTVRLYRYSDGAVLASVAHTSTYAFGYTPITPVTLEQGVTYVVAVELAGGDGARMAATLPVPSDYLHLRIDCPGTSRAAGTGMPSSCDSRYIGLADVEIDFNP